MLALAGDELTFVAFEQSGGDRLTLEGDTLVSAGQRYDFSGRKGGDASGNPRLQPVRASQEFWHSWQSSSRNLAWRVGGELAYSQPVLARH